MSELSTDNISYYIGFTPSCNKDLYTTCILSSFTSKLEAEECLARWMKHYIHIMDSLELFKVESYTKIVDEEEEEENNYKIDVSHLSYPYIQQYVFESEENEIDYSSITGHSFICLACTSGPLFWRPSFWIIGADRSVFPGKIREDLMNLVI